MAHFVRQLIDDVLLMVYHLPKLSDDTLVSLDTQKNRKFGYLMVIEEFLLALCENKSCGHSLEAPHRGTSNEYPQLMFL